jgi:hypothetical protein
MGTAGKTWKRGARPGNYTDIQLNIACRVSVMGMPNGKDAYNSPGSCPTVTQAKISLGILPVFTCRTRRGPSPCRGVGS